MFCVRDLRVLIIVFAIYKNQKWRIALSKAGNGFLLNHFNEGNFVDIIKLDCFGAKSIYLSIGKFWKRTAVLVLPILFLFYITLFKKCKQYIYNFFCLDFFFFLRRRAKFSKMLISLNNGFII